MADTLLHALVGDEAYQRMRIDPVAFVRVFDREPWPYQAAYLRAILERDPEGRFIKPVAVLSLPRQNGKSTLGAWVALWNLFMLPTCDQIVSVALDRASAGIIIGDARRILLGSDLLLSCVDADYGLTRNEIRLRDGRRWLIKSSDAVFSRGLRPSLVVMDEMGWLPSSDLFEVLTAAQAAQVNPLTLVVSTVGPVQAGPLWQLFEAADRGDPTIRLLYSQQNESPLISADYLERQRGLMPSHIWNREHANTWGAGSDAFCTDKDWRRCTGEIDPRRDRDPGPSYLFVDLGWTHDVTAIAVARPNHDDAVDILALEVFKGSREAPVQIAAVRNRIEELVVRLGVVHVVCESPQGLGLSQDLQVPKKCRVDVLYPTALSNRERWGALYTALHEGAIRLPNDPLLRRQLLTLTIVSGPTGWRVDDVPSVHNDLAVVCAGSYFAATNEVESRWKHIPFLALTPYGAVGAGMKVLFDEDSVEYRNLSEDRKTRIRQLVLAGVSLDTIRVRYGMTMTTLVRVMDDIGWHKPDQHTGR